MTIRTSFPGPSGVASSYDVRQAMKSLVAEDSNGEILAGLFLTNNGDEDVRYRRSNADLSIAIRPFNAVLDRDGALFITNDADYSVLLPPAPSTNSRYDVIYVKQNENQTPYTDGTDVAVIAVVSGTPGVSPSKNAALALVPEGAIALLSILVPAGATRATGSGVIVAEEFRYTALRDAPIPFRTYTEMLKYGRHTTGQLAKDMDQGHLWVSQIGDWVVPGNPPEALLPIDGSAELPADRGVGFVNTQIGNPQFPYGGTSFYTVNNNREVTILKTGLYEVEFRIAMIPRGGAKTGYGKVFIQKNSRVWESSPPTENVLAEAEVAISSDHREWLYGKSLPTILQAGDFIQCGAYNGGGAQAADGTYFLRFGNTFQAGRSGQFWRVRYLGPSNNR